MTTRRAASGGAAAGGLVLVLLRLVRDPRTVRRVEISAARRCVPIVRRSLPDACPLLRAMRSLRATATLGAVGVPVAALDLGDGSTARRRRPRAVWLPAVLIKFVEPT